MKNINIAEILKYCPKGIHLYSPICGKCTFDSLNKGTIICITQNNQKITFTSEGYYMLPVFEDSECVLFPSKEIRDWNKIRYFKDADIVASTISYKDTWVGIFKQYINKNFESYCFINGKGVFNNIGLKTHSLASTRLATKEEKAKLFQAIKDNGYHWNEETKTLEKLVEPKFKVGDMIVKRNSITNSWIVSSVSSEYYGLKLPEGFEGIGVLPVSEQDDYELLLNTDKFDITTLKPFDKVLIRDSDTQKWSASLFSYCDGLKSYKYTCINGSGFKQCIPYEGNEHLLGTTNDCSEYYKTW